MLLRMACVGDGGTKGLCTAADDRQPTFRVGCGADTLSQQASLLGRQARDLADHARGQPVDALAEHPLELAIESTDVDRAVSGERRLYYGKHPG